MRHIVNVTANVVVRGRGGTSGDRGRAGAGAIVVAVEAVVIVVCASLRCASSLHLRGIGHLCHILVVVIIAAVLVVVVVVKVVRVVDEAKRVVVGITVVHVMVEVDRRWWSGQRGSGHWRHCRSWWCLR